jgi:hypothetical protein
MCSAVALLESNAVAIEDGELGEIAERRKSHILQLIFAEFFDPASQQTKLQPLLRQIHRSL